MQTYILILLVIGLLVLVGVAFAVYKTKNSKVTPSAGGRQTIQRDVINHFNGLLQDDELKKVFDKLTMKEKRDNPIMLQTFDQVGQVMTLRSWRQMELEMVEDNLQDYFAMWWIPPPSRSTGNPGYIPAIYDNFNSYWGSEEDFIAMCNTAKKYGIELMADMVFHHSEGVNPKGDPDWDYWWRLGVVSDNKNLTPDQYAAMWQYDRNYRYPGEWGSEFQRGGKVEEAKTPQKTCMFQNEKGDWRIQPKCVPTDPNTTACDSVLPLYSVDWTVENQGDLKAINLCSLDVLKAQIKFMHRLGELGVHSVRWDQLNGISPSTMKLYLNSNPAKTEEVLRGIKGYCNKVRAFKNCPKAYVGAIEEQIDAILKSPNKQKELKALTAPPHNYSVVEAFTGQLKPNMDTCKNNPTSMECWWTLTGELDRINDNLDPKDMTGAFDFGLLDVMRQVFTNFGNLNELFYLNPKAWANVQSKALCLVDNEKYKRLSYTFVANHDTDQSLRWYGDSFENRGAVKDVRYNQNLMMYFVIMMMPGYPSVYKWHLYWFKDMTKIFARLRYTLGIRWDSVFSNPTFREGENAFIGWKITGKTAKGTPTTYLCRLDVVRPNNPNKLTDPLIFEYTFERPDKKENPQFLFVARVYQATK